MYLTGFILCFILTICITVKYRVWFKFVQSLKYFLREDRSNDQQSLCFLPIPQMALAQNKTMSWQSWTSKYNKQEVDKKSLKTEYTKLKKIFKNGSDTNYTFAFIFLMFWNRNIWILIINVTNCNSQCRGLRQTQKNAIFEKKINAYDCLWIAEYCQL